jgi:HAD superfamily phosphoserine phosphatase-like hydrolase
MKPAPLVFFDFDSTVVSVESLDETLRLALEKAKDKDRRLWEIAQITALGMAGKLDFRKSLERRITAAPITRDIVQRASKSFPETITPGIPNVFRALSAFGAKIFLISGGFLELIYPTADALGVPRERCFANTFSWYEDDLVCGFDPKNPLAEGGGKSVVVKNIRKSYPGPGIFVGDGMNDVCVFEEGATEYMIGFGQNTVRPEVRRKAPHYALNSVQLQDILFSFVL